MRVKEYKNTNNNNIKKGTRIFRHHVGAPPLKWSLSEASLSLSLSLSVGQTDTHWASGHRTDQNGGESHWTTMNIISVNEEVRIAISMHTTNLMRESIDSQSHRSSITATSNFKQIKIILHCIAYLVCISLLGRGGSYKTRRLIRHSLILTLTVAVQSPHQETPFPLGIIFLSTAEITDVLPTRRSTIILFRRL